MFPSKTNRDSQMSVEDRHHDEGVSAESSTGLDPNIAGALAYFLGPITGILFYVLEDDDQFVRFHAGQSIVLSGAVIVFSVVFTVGMTVLAAIPVVGWLIGLVVGLLSLLFAPVLTVFWLFLMYKAYKGVEYEIPALGRFTRRNLLE